MKYSDPQWNEDGLLNISSSYYRRRKAALDDMLLLAEKLGSAESRDAEAVESLSVLIDDARRLSSSLLCAAKASQTLQAKNSRAPAERSEILSAIEKLESLAERCFSLAESLGSVGVNLQRWMDEQRRSRGTLGRRRSDEDRRIEEPLGALYTHLKSGMKLTIAGEGGMPPSVMSCSSAESVLKNSSDSSVRRQVYGAYNAWFADNAAPFAALINAQAGHRLNLVERGGLSVLDYSLQTEKLSRPAFEAMISAVRASAPAARKAVELSGAILAFCEGRRPGMPVSSLFAPLPGAASLEAAESFDGAASALIRALNIFYPDFERFLSEEIEGGWIETRNLSGGEGGTWCMSVPAANAVAVYADYQPTLNRAGELAHVLGEASLRHHLLTAPESGQVPTVLSCEIAGRFFSDAFLAKLLVETSDCRRQHAAVLWECMRHMAVNLLYLPFRFDLAEAIHEERRHGYLSVNTLNSLTNTAWSRYFADSVRGSDQYVWAAKNHFYLPRMMHYDWQYTVGYLLAAILRRSLRKQGRTACGGTFGDFLSDSAELSCDDLIRKHLAAEPEREAFWRDAVSEALKPLTDADRHLRAFIPD